MHRSVITATLSSVILSLFAATANAELLTVPDKVRASILKRHPTAQELQTNGYETHFGQKLLEVTFVEEGSTTPIIELYRSSGHLFAAEVAVADLNAVPSDVRDAISKAFPDSQMKKAEMMVNPNGAGEEHEILLLTGGDMWRVIVNHKSEIISKERAQ